MKESNEEVSDVGETNGGEKIEVIIQRSEGKSHEGGKGTTQSNSSNGFS